MINLKINFISSALNGLTLLPQVQSAAQHKYLYEAIADYAKRVQKGEKPMDNEEQSLLPEGDEGDDDYVLED